MDASEAIGTYFMAILALLYFAILILLYFQPITLVVIALLATKKTSPSKRPLPSTTPLTTWQLLLGISAAIIAFVCYGLLDLGTWLTAQWRKRT